MADDQAEKAKRAAMQAQNKAIADRTAEQYRRMDNARPTPSQEENDLAKLGVAVDQKADHGGEPEDEALARQFAPSPPATGDYLNRELSSGADDDKGAAGTAAKRRGGRRKKAA